MADVDPEGLDLDGEGITDVLLPFDSRYPEYTGTDTRFLDPSVVAAPQPFNKKDEKRSIYGISIDLSYPVISRKMFNLVLYAETGILNYTDTLTSTVREDGTTISANTGNGLIGPGLRAQPFKFLTLTFEDRKPSALSQRGLFTTTYDFERAQVLSDTTASGQESTGV